MLKPTALLLLLAAVFLAAPTAAHAQARKTKSRAHKSPPANATKRAAAALYSCPMHPDMTSTSPGDTCAKCGMNLVKSEPAAVNPTEPTATKKKKKKHARLRHVTRRRTHQSH
jgi:Ni/Co efflux regulator RcnB